MTILGVCFSIRDSRGPETGFALLDTTDDEHNVVATGVMPHKALSLDDGTMNFEPVRADYTTCIENYDPDLVAILDYGFLASELMPYVFPKPNFPPPCFMKSTEMGTLLGFKAGKKEILDFVNERFDKAFEDKEIHIASAIGVALAGHAQNTTFTPF